MTVLNPRIARQAYRRGYAAYLSGQSRSSNPYRMSRSAGDRYELWLLGWENALSGKPSQENNITYEWLLS